MTTPSPKLACEHCGYSIAHVVITLTDGVRSQMLCPNCIAYGILDNKISFTNNPNFIDDITRKSGAVRFEAYGESYTLERCTMMRLLAHNLHPAEYKALAKKYGADKYMIHDDFYDEDGNAIQPMM